MTLTYSRKHLYLDLCPWICHDLNCNFGTELFQTREDWIQHLGLEHGLYPEWNSFSCPMCHDETGDGKFAITRHLSSHMEEISLAALPAGIDLDNDSDMDSAVEDKSDDTEECHRCKIRKNRTDMTSIYTFLGLYATVWECRECDPSRSRSPSPATSVDSYAMQRTAEREGSVQARVDDNDLHISDETKERNQTAETEVENLLTPAPTQNHPVLPRLPELVANMPAADLSRDQDRPGENAGDDRKAKWEKFLAGEMRWAPPGVNVDRLGLYGVFVCE